MKDTHWKCQICWSTKLTPLWAVDSQKCVECRHVHCDSCKDKHFKFMIHVPIGKRFACVQCKARGSKLVKVFPPFPLTKEKRKKRALTRERKKEETENLVGGIVVEKEIAGIVAADAAELRAEEGKEQEEGKGGSDLGESPIEGEDQGGENDEELGLVHGNMGEEIVPEAGIYWNAYTCLVCGRKFVGKGATGKKSMHMDHAHGKPHQCQICGKSIERKDNFKTQFKCAKKAKKDVPLI